MRVAILYICTGKYNQFFDGFYNSCQKYLLKGIAEIEYFVFTDNMNLSTAKDVHLFYRECQGFPLDSLFRFDMFLSIKDMLEKFDYCYFFNANMELKAPVNEEFLPDDSGLVAVIHPGFYNKPSFLLPYERNKNSEAYIPPHNGPYRYYMGSLNGGRTKEYLQLIEICSRNTHSDYDKGIIAMVHDESHLNKYLSENKVKGLSPAFAYPENWRLPFSPLILIRDKVRIDPYFNKGRDHSIWGKIKKRVKYLNRVIKWYF